MPQYTITPWRNYSELIQVKHDLFPHTLSSTINANSNDDTTSSQIRTPEQRQQHAVHLVATWSMRGKVPHAVQSTALLIEAQLHHAACSPDASAFSVRATYALAFCRFITGYCDIGLSIPTALAAEATQSPSTYTVPDHSHQTRPDKPRPQTQAQAHPRRTMHAAAATLGMPASWVDLRHAATHGALPGVTRLEAATAAALAWLWENYWAKLGPAADSAAGSTVAGSGTASSAPLAESSEAEQHADEQTLRGVLEGFVRGRRAELREGDGATRKQQQEATKEAGLQVIRLCRGYESKLQTLVRVMVATRMMVADGRRPNDSMEGAFLIWTPLILTLAKYQTLFLPLLLKHLVSVLASPDYRHPPPDVFREALYEWVLYIVTKSAEGADGEKIRSVIVSECVLSAFNKWTGPLATRLVSEGNDAFRKRWAVYLPENLDGANIRG